MKKLFKKCSSGIKNLISEFKKVKWCKFKVWISTGAIVIIVGSVVAILLNLFDLLSYYAVSLLGGLF